MIKFREHNKMKKSLHKVSVHTGSPIFPLLCHSHHLSSSLSLIHPLVLVCSTSDYVSVYPFISFSSV